MTIGRINLSSSASVFALLAASTEAGSAVTKPDWVPSDMWDAWDGEQRHLALTDGQNVADALGLDYEPDGEDDTGDDDTETEPSTHKGFAAELAAKISDHTRTDMKSAIDRAETSALDTLVILSDLQKDFGEDLADLPTPGSTKGNNADVFKFTVKSDRTGKTREKTGSVLKEIWALGLGNEIEREITRWSDAVNKKASALSDYAKMPDVIQSARLARFRKQRTLSTNLFIRAVSLGKQFAVAKEHDTIRVRFFKDQDGSISKGPNPIQILNVAKVKNKAGEIEVHEEGHKAISVSTFLGYKFDVAAKTEHGVNVGSLTASNSTTGGDGQGGDGEAEGKGPMLTLKTFDTTMAKLQNYCEKVQEDTAVRQALLKHLLSDAGKDTLIAVMAVAEFFAQEIESKPDMRKRAKAAIEEIEKASGQKETRAA